MNEERACFQKIGGLLIETTAKDALQNLESQLKESIEPQMKDILQKKKYFEEQLQDLEDK